MNKFRDFNCESTSELSKREHCKEDSDELARKVDAWLALGNKPEQIPWGQRTQP